MNPGEASSLLLDATECPGSSCDDGSTVEKNQTVSQTPLEDDVSPSLSSRFEVDVHQIESVTVEDQDTDIQTLGLTVYNQSTLERGIWDQVEREARKREAQEELNNVTSKLKLAEEQLKRVTSAKGRKRSILQDALEEPSKKKTNPSTSLKHEEITQEKIKELRLKHAELKSRLASKNTTLEDVDCNQESERDRKIRMGEMTPFGTTLNATSSDLSSFEKYLKSQQELHKKMLSEGSVRKKTSLSKSVKSNKTLNKSHSEKKGSSSSILKKSILFPKKRCPKEKLGTSTSISEENQQRSPGEAPGESSVVDFEDSGSEYIPSDEDGSFHAESPEKRPSLSSHKSTPNKHHPSYSKSKQSDRWAGGSLKRRKRKLDLLPDGDPEDWRSDDSDWLSTDDEFSSDNDSNKKNRRSKRGKDDGNSEDFYRRIKHWERKNEGLREQMEEDVHEFENGFKLPVLIWDKLYTYQQVGVRWMWELNQQRCGGILGDEMGLGKTIQIISFLAGLSISGMKCRTTGYRSLGPTLIVCPTTVMHQWVREFHTWFPPLRVAILHESGSFIGRRSQLVRDILHGKGIIITSYTAVVRLKDYLIHQRWHYVILDEGHKIRNPDAQVTLAVKQLRTPHRLILSGSPLQNNLRELWSLMDFVFPGKLGTLPVFMSEFAVPINQGGYSNASEVMVATAYKCATVLRDTISPYLLRRMKADVSEHIRLPSKNEQVLFCRLTDEQRDLYKGYLQCGEVGRILEGRCQIFVGLINLRKICNHPHLYSGGPKLFANEKEEDISEEERFGYWEKAGKMVVMEALLKMWHKQEHRVLIFTQSRQMLLIMEKFVCDRGYRYLKMDGGTSIAARQPMITKFNEDKSYFVMLLTTKVGGLGVNLTGANRVVIYDPDWNPATDTQARERAWRIGQKNAVTVYRLITAGTIEEKMYHRQIFKQFLCNKVLKDPRQRRFFKSNDLLELFTLKETDDGSTETSAIFAGTKAQVHVKPKSSGQKDGKDKKALHRPSHRHNERNVGYLDNNTKHKPSNAEEPLKISFSQDKLEHMKKLAHELSLKLASKAGTNLKVKQENDENVEVLENPSEKSDVNYTGCLGEVNLCDAEESTIDLSKHSEKAIVKVSVGTSASSSCAAGIQLQEDSIKSEPTNNTLDCSNVLGELSHSKGIYDSDEDLEDMRLLAHELSKELLHKVQVAAAINKPKFSSNCETETRHDRSASSSKTSTSFEDTGKLVGPDCLENNYESVDSTRNLSVPCKLETQFEAINVPPSEQKTSRVRSSSLSQSSTSLEKSPSNRPGRSQKSLKGKEKETMDPCLSSKHKKSKKHKKLKKHSLKDGLLEGERVRGLVKSSNLEDTTKEEMAAEASHNAKQDDYVLRKLFSKAGIKTAMQHDRIMESGHADYALVEGEARKVAQEAIKAMKASRQQCWNPMTGQPTWTGASGSQRAGEERENRSQTASQQAQTRLQQPRPKFGKKKIVSHNSGSQDSKGAKSAEEEGSSNLLARIRARNILLTEEDDANDLTGAAPVVQDKNQELLDDIRTFVAFGASVDGRATTDEIVSQFRDRLPDQTSALFKQMLMQICEFHRLPSGQGIWKIIPEFNW